MFKNTMFILSVSICIQVFSIDRVSYLVAEEDYTSPDLEAFLALPFSEEEQSTIRETLGYLVKKTKNELIENAEYFNTFVQKIESIHTLRLAGFVFSDPKMRQDIQVIGQTYKAVFLLVFEFELKNIIESGLFDREVFGFIEFLNLDRALVSEYIGKKKYGEVVSYLMQI